MFWIDHYITDLLVSLYRDIDRLQAECATLQEVIGAVFQAKTDSSPEKSDLYDSDSETYEIVRQQTENEDSDFSESGEQESDLENGWATIEDSSARKNLAIVAKMHGTVPQPVDKTEGTVPLPSTLMTKDGTVPLPVVESKKGTVPLPSTNLPPDNGTVPLPDDVSKKGTPSLPKQKERATAAKGTVPLPVERATATNDSVEGFLGHGMHLDHFE